MLGTGASTQESGRTRSVPNNPFQTTVSLLVGQELHIRNPPHPPKGDVSEVPSPVLSQSGQDLSPPATLTHASWVMG